MIGTVNSVASSDGCEDYMMKYIKLTSATHKGNQCETKGDTKTTNASSNETLLRFYKNHFSMRRYHNARSNCLIDVF